MSGQREFPQGQEELGEAFALIQAMLVARQDVEPSARWRRKMRERVGDDPAKLVDAFETVAVFTAGLYADDIVIRCKAAGSDPAERLREHALECGIALLPDDE